VMAARKHNSLKQTAPRSSLKIRSQLKFAHSSETAPKNSTGHRGPKMAKTERQAACIREAFALAESGEHSNYLTIETMLSTRYPEARNWLDSHTTHDDLNQMCNQARKRKPYAPWI
jgi:hypothetical protein